MELGRSDVWFEGVTVVGSTFWALWYLWPCLRWYCQNENATSTTSTSVRPRYGSQMNLTGIPVCVCSGSKSVLADKVVERCSDRMRSSLVSPLVCMLIFRLLQTK